MPELPPASFQQWGVFTRAQAIAAGWSDATLSRRCSAGALVKLRRGIYAEAVPYPDEYGRATARLAQQGVAPALTIDGGTVSHAASAAVQGLALLETPRLPCLTLVPPYLTQRLDLHLHRHTLPADQISSDYPFNITSIARTCIDVTREHGLAAGLVTADDALHRGLISIGDLTRVYDESCRGRAGLRDGRRLLELVDPLCESPLESISRLALQKLPIAPRTQVPIFAANGHFIGRVDFYWDELGVVGEADGRGKYTDDELWKEKIRHDELSEHGVVVTRWTWATACKPGALPAQMDDAFARARQLRSAGIRPTIRVSRPEFP